MSERAFHRALTKGDGFHALGLDVEGAVSTVERVRRDRPEESFTISLRTGWDALGMEHDRIRAERDAFEAAGVQTMIAAPWRKNIDDWLRAMEVLAGLVGLVPR